MIRLICADLDGTLIGSHGVVHPAIWEAAAHARAAGIRLAICSGRPAFGLAREYAERLDADGWHIFQNGASVLQLKGGGAHSANFPDATVAWLKQRAHDTGRVLELYSDHDFVVEVDSPDTREHSALLGVPFRARPFDALGAPVVRAQWLLRRVRDDAVLHEPHPGIEMSPSTSPVMPETLFVSLMVPGVDKGTGVRAVADEYGISIEEVMFVGDAWNDLAALRIVGHPVAMGNAEPEVRALARHVVADVDAGGLAEAIAVGDAAARGGVMRSARRAALCTVAAGIAVVACSRSGRDDPSAARERASTVEWWLTVPDSSQRLAAQPPLARDAGAATPAPDSGSGSTARIEVDPGQEFQSMIGFGAALTDASAWLLHTALGDSGRTALLEELFGRDSTEGSAGIGLSFARVTIGASDFSRSHYSLDDLPAGLPAGTRDDSLAHYSFAPMRDDVVPMLLRARALNPALTVMATPWSAPAWMKSTHSLVQGTLRPDAYPAFAAYLQRVVADFAASGVPIALLSVQNEPHFEPADYPGMRFSPAARADFLAHHLGPLLASRNPDTHVLDWDHNWDQPESPLAVLGDSAARPYVAGIAWHCYAGDVAAQSQVHDAYPDKDAYFTECAGGEWAPNWGDNLRWNTRTLIIGTTRHWARGVALWNLALDERHGPHTGGCNDCRGVLTIDTQTGVVTRNPEYYALAHASRFVRVGAHRIASTSPVGDVESVAFRNGDDGSRVLLVVNLAKTSRVLEVREVGRGAMTFRAEMPAGAVATFRWY